MEQRFNVSHLLSDYSREHACPAPTLEQAKAFCRKDGAVHFQKNRAGEYIAFNKHHEAIHVITEVALPRAITE